VLKYCVKTAFHLPEAFLYRDVTDDTDSPPAALLAPPPHPAHSLLAAQCDALENAAEKARVDHVNVRRLLWEAMLLFPHIAEAKSRVIAPLLFRFLE
jgi:hypothetical protein